MAPFGPFQVNFPTDRKDAKNVGIYLFSLKGQEGVKLK